MQAAVRRPTTEVGKLWQGVFRGSISRAIFLAFLTISIVPIVVISILFVNQSTQALTAQMEANVQTLVGSKAEELNQRLSEVLHTTQIAAQHTAVALQTEVSDAEVAAGLARYQLDERNLLGLDVYYNAQGGADALGTSLSNVYWNNDTPLTDAVARQIIQTESLDAIYASIKSVSPDTQWIYMTTPDGMMRLFPWADNAHYPDDWDPREIIFYTVADAPNNPDLTPEWTAPYVDYAGAGWMVTLSMPMTSADGDFLGIMSHDITIREVQRLVQDIKVLDGAGYGFLIDANGGVISHPEFQDDAASKGSQEEVSLLNWGSAEFSTIVAQMVQGNTGIGHFGDSAGEQILVYAPVPTIGWSLGIVVPRSEVVAPAQAMRTRAITITALLVAAAVAVSLIFTRTLHQPLLQLLNGVHQVSEDSKADSIQVDSFHEFNKLAKAFNEMAAKVWERERRLKARVKELSIEIDMQRKESQVKQLVETDYFQHLELNAQRLRANVKGGD